MSKEYVAKESTSQQILAKVNSISGGDLASTVVFVGDFKNDTMVVTKGAVNTLDRRVTARFS